MSIYNYCSRILLFNSIQLNFNGFVLQKNCNKILNNNEMKLPSMLLVGSLVSFGSVRFVVIYRRSGSMNGNHRRRQYDMWIGLTNVSGISTLIVVIQRLSSAIRVCFIVIWIMISSFGIHTRNKSQWVLSVGSYP